MKNRKKSIFIALLVVVVFVITIFLLTPKERTQGSNNITERNITIVPLSGNLKHVEIKWKNGDVLSYIVSRGADGKEIYAVENNNGAAVFDDYRLKVVADLGISMKADRVVEEQTNDLVKFGLDAPKMSFTYTSDTGDSTTLYIGNYTAAGDWVYLKNNREPTIFLETSLNIQNFNKTLEEFKEVSLLPDTWVWKNNVNTVFNTLKTMSLELKGKGIAFRLRRCTDGEMENRPEGKAPFIFEAPAKAYANADTVYGKFIDKLLSITRGATPVESKPDDLSVYGLDNPLAIITIEDSETVCRLLIGQKKGSKSFYIMREGYNDIVIAAFENVTLDFNFYELVDDSFWKFETSSVKSAIFEHNERLVIDFAKDTQGKLLSAKVDNDLESAKIAQAIFDAIFSIGYEDKTGIPVSKPDFRITLNMENGKKHILEAQQINSRHCTVRLDGEDTGMYCKLADLEKIESSLKANLAGK